VREEDKKKGTRDDKRIARMTKFYRNNKGEIGSDKKSFLFLPLFSSS